MKHKEIAKAWLDGAQVEVKMQSGKWVLINAADQSTRSYWFGDAGEYRIKPNAVEVKFKIYKQVETNEIRCVDIKACWEYDSENWVCISDEQTLEVPLKI